MAQTFRNLVGGEWVAGAGVTTNRNPSDVSDVIGDYAQADAPQAGRRDRRGEGARFRRGRPARSRSARTSSTAQATKSSRARTSSGSSFRARKARRCPKAIGEAARAGHIFKFFAGEALRLTGDKVPSVRPGIDVEVTREPHRRRRPHHAVEFPDRDSGVEDRAGARVRQHGRDEAGRPRPRLRMGDRRHPRASRHSRRRVQPRDGSRLGRRRDAGQPSGRRGAQLHRLGRDRPRHRREGGRADGQGAARDGRQESAGRARRRRPRRRRQLRGAGRAIIRPASAARRPRASSSPRASTTASSRR